MKRVLLLFLSVFYAVGLWAGTPIEELVVKYKEVRGTRSFCAEGVMMTFARPFLKSYPIAPLADNVEQMSVLKVEKVDDEVRKIFLQELGVALNTYIYTGKSDSPNGLVDAYVHLSSQDVADELVVFNPELMALYTLKGQFAVEDLRKINKKP